MSAARDTIESRLGRVEFIAMISMLMAVVALAIDMMLPAFGAMRSQFGLTADSNALAPIVTFFFLGLALGQPIFGPLSDALGRKRVLYLGLAVYILASIAAAFAPSLFCVAVPSLPRRCRGSRAERHRARCGPRCL